MMRIRVVSPRSLSDFKVVLIFLKKLINKSRFDDTLSSIMNQSYTDKVCDTVSDAVLDACLEQDVNSRVACETFAKDHMLGLAGEIRTSAEINYEAIARECIKEIGYSEDLATEEYSYSCSFSAEKMFFLNFLGRQSPEIAQGVDEGEADGKATAEQGAGDQGIMFGYAIDETPEYMPTPIAFSHKLAENITKLRKAGTLPWLRPDAKTQVSVEYVDGKPVRIPAVVVSTMHAEEISTPDLREIITKELIHKSLPQELLTEETELHINPTGRL